MTEYLTEQEQIELIKRWIKQYSGVVLGGIVLAIAISSGWNYWREHQIQKLDKASALFDEMSAMRQQNDTQNVNAKATKLYTDYPKTPYGQLAALMLAREDVAEKDYDSAQRHLNWVIDNSNVTAIRQIARLRLSRLLIAINKPSDSIKLLSTVDDKTFAGLIDEVRGDAYVKMNNVDAARTAYKQALAELPNADTVRPTLQMKYDNLST